jgi:plastocyanin
MLRTLLLAACLALGSTLDIEWTVTGEETIACVKPGETVNFNWSGPWHTVLDLGADMDAWESCTFPGGPVEEGEEGPWSVTLAEEGMFHYVCTVLTHCSEGRQKAMITVSNDC